MNKDRKYVIVSNEHKSWPAGALLFWGRLTEDDQKRSYGGYTTRWDKCEKYTREELVDWRGSLIEHFPFFDELDDPNAYNFSKHNEVLCTLEDLEKIGYSIWTVVCRA